MFTLMYGLLIDDELCWVSADRRVILDHWDQCQGMPRSMRAYRVPTREMPDLVAGRRPVRLDVWARLDGCRVLIDEIA